MKKAFLLLCFLFSISIGFSHTATDQLQYSIIFGNCFENENISLKVNRVLVFQDQRMQVSKKDKKGNLSLRQTNKGITIFYNGQQKNKAAIKFDFILNLDIAINGRWTNHKIDLRKGKIVLIEFCANQKNTNSVAKKLSIEQIQEPVVLM